MTLHIELRAADYHRNGTSGDGFIVATFYDYDEDEHMVAVFFAIDAECAVCMGSGVAELVVKGTDVPAGTQGCPVCNGKGYATTYTLQTAVLSVDKLGEDNVFMNCSYTGKWRVDSNTGGAAYRGYDDYAPELWPMVQEFLEQQEQFRTTETKKLENNG